MIHAVRSLLAAVLLLCACRSAPEAQAAAAPSHPGVPAQALFDVCWPANAAPSQRLELSFISEGGAFRDVLFAAKEGASNSVGRCMREIALSYPWAAGELPAATLQLSPPATRPSGWVQLAYVQLLSGAPAARGVAQPAPLVAACLKAGDARPSLRYRVQPVPVRVEVEPGVVTDAERCVAAVLGATVYGTTRPLDLDFSAPPPVRPAPAAEVAAYFWPRLGEPRGVLPPGQVKEALTARQPAISACWESALARRAGLFGGRSVRLRVGQDGTIQAAQVTANRSDAADEASDLLLDRCLVGALQGTRLTAPSGGDAELVYSWVFAHR